jgi:hypothetical protein
MTALPSGFCVQNTRPIAVSVDIFPDASCATE